MVTIPDYVLLAKLTGLLIGGWWLSEKLSRIRDDIRSEKAVRALERKLYELGRSHRGWE